MQISGKKFVAIAFILLSVSCADFPRSDPPPDDTQDSSEESIIQNDSYVLNPYGVAPLSGIINIETKVPVQVRVTVSGNNEKDDIVKVFDSLETEHEIPVLGLYPGAINIVQVDFLNGEGAALKTKAYTFSTRSLDYKLPQIVVNAADYLRMSDGWTFVSYYGDLRPPYQPFMFDSEGDIRWYLDYSSHPILGDLIYDNGMERLANGNLYFGDTATDKIYEIDMLGKILNSWDMPGYGFHHQVLEKPDGNFLVTVNKEGEQTTQDHIIEIDRLQNTIVKVWDLRESLQYSRRVLAGDDSNWFHLNAIEYSPDDNCIIVSGRVQGVVKLTQENEVVWILSPHYGWGFSGDGTDLTNYLLQPLDASGMAITSMEVIDGFANHSDFEWSWGQHAPHLIPNGNIMLFDNGDNRNFVGYGPYSRNVEYDIDEDNMTIRQVWQYGKERGNETFSRYFSDVDYDPEDHHVFFSPGGVINMDRYGKVIELDYSTGDVIFEATVFPPLAVPVTFHRTERMPLYAD